MSDKKVKNIFVDGPISPVKIGEDIAYHQKKTQIGAHGIFMGQVRADDLKSHALSSVGHPGSVVEAIEYTAHREMSLTLMQGIRESIFDKYPLVCLHVTHSLGLVKAGEICLFVFASAVHRSAAMDACSEVVERIKGELPIWGKEVLGDGNYQWKENKG